ncbi:MAG TPA: hypothetical protein VGF86_15280 [Candidatus Tumulicola sp.]|jgi:hypothetical protein
MNRKPRRVYDLLLALLRFVYARPVLLGLLPFAVFFPLLDSRGLYEYGDANFPLNPFWVDYMLPWSGAASAGADNTFIGVPRLVYHLGINLLIGVFHNLQVAQWLWYSSMAALGLIGAFLLVRRLGAGIYSVALAIFYGLNLWSYDRVAQGPIFLSYQAVPLAVYLFLRYLKRPGLAGALYVGCSLLLVIPAPQISYLAALVCLGIAVREVLLRGPRVIAALAGLALAVVAANAFYVFSMAADALLNSGGNIALVNQRFNMGVFEHYAANVGIFSTLALQSFFYTSVARQPWLVQAGALFLPLALAAVLLLMRRPTLKSRFYAGLALALLGLWLVDGIAIAPGAYAWMHFVVPGLRSFVEPDYFSPLYIWGAFVMLATAVRLGARAYGAAWRAAIWLVALSGVVAFLPIYGPASGLPRTSQPRQYRDFARTQVPGNTLWMPPNRGVRYRWSPYVINGFTSLNSPSDAIGPTMAEWVSLGTQRVQERLAQGFMAGQLKTVEALAPLLGVGTVAIAADSLSPAQQWPDPEVSGALATFDALGRRGFLTARADYREDLVHLIVGTTASYLPEVGVYGAPVYAGGFDDFMWRAVTSNGGRYVPVAADGDPRVQGTPLRAVAPPLLLTRRIPPAALQRSSTCGNGGSALRIPHGAASFTVTTREGWRCLSMRLARLGSVAALRLRLDAQPADVAALSIAFGNRAGMQPLDPSLAAQEVPFGARSALVVVKIPPQSRVTIRGIELQWAARGTVAPPPPARTCAASGVTWSRQNPLFYTLAATVRGRCTLVFRQSFAPIWSAYAEGPNARILGHLQVDGFANGWIVDASGPVTFRIVNRALFAYAAGMILTVGCVLCALGFAVRNRLTRLARRGRRVPSPA